MNPRNYSQLKANNLVTLTKNAEVDPDGIQRYTLSYFQFDSMTGQKVQAGSDAINPDGWKGVVENYVKSMTDSNQVEWQSTIDSLNAMLSDITALG